MNRSLPIPLLLLTLPVLAQDPPAQLASLGEVGQQGGQASLNPSLDFGGRRLAFKSYSDDLVAGDTNGKADAFVHDLDTGTTVLVSVGVGGVVGNKDVVRVDLSTDGTVAAFSSSADNLVPGDNNGARDIFVHVLATGVTERVSESTAGVAANFHCADPDLSADGRFVAYDTPAGNLVPGDTNGATDVFVHDRLTGITERVSVSSTGAQANSNSAEASISADGRLVAFTSGASNLVPGDTNGVTDNFVHDRLTGATVCVSLTPSGSHGNGGSSWPQMSDDGTHVAFSSTASDLVPGDLDGTADVYVVELATGIMERVSRNWNGSETSGYCSVPEISADGRYVAFGGELDHMTPMDNNGLPDAYRYDRETGELILCSRGPQGQLGNQGAGRPAISGDGSAVAFATNSTNFVVPDLNGFEPDVFLSRNDLGTSFCESTSNSSGGHAVVWATGSSVVAAQDFHLRADYLPTNKTGIFIVSAQEGFVPFIGGSQGNLCLAPPIARLMSQVQDSGPAGTFAAQLDLGALPPPLNTSVQPGDSWSFSAWFRDDNPGPTSNLANGVTVTFQ